MTFEQIKELIDLVREGQLQGLEIEERSGQRVKITGRAAGVPSAQVVSATAPPVRAPLPAASAPFQEAAAEPVAELPAGGEAVAPAEDGHVLTSPIVGTFYAAAGPDSDPYVQVGSTVRKGQVLCIVEAMKLMNEIESDVNGMVKKVFPKNAQPVEYGEPLFLIEAS
ncbi:MAG: acetyl-CoA carboxylase biotin carboxyl carrier protein [Thermoanaerobaculia bacterium]